MNNLSNTIYDFYLGNFQGLPFDKRFHFGSRLTQWGVGGDIDGLFRVLVHHSRPTTATLSQQLATLLALSANEQTGLNAGEARAPYFAKYSLLYGAHQALFQVRHWLQHYEIDARPVLLQQISLEQLQSLGQSLLSDPAALSTLSTYAVNFWYLLHRCLLADNQQVFSAEFVSSLPFNGSNSQSVSLLCYFITHCVIGETNFYARPVPRVTLENYRALLAFVEPHLAAQRHHLSLDVQLEFLVASELCGYKNPLKPAILQTAAEHYDPSLGFIIDPIKPAKNTLAGAEHRNALFIMASTPTPLSP